MEGPAHSALAPPRLHWTQQPEVPVPARKHQFVKTGGSGESSSSLFPSGCFLVGISQPSASTSPLAFPGGARSTVGMVESVREKAIDRPNPGQKALGPRPPALPSSAWVPLAAPTTFTGPRVGAQTRMLSAGARWSSSGPAGVGGTPRPPPPTPTPGKVREMSRLPPRSSITPLPHVAHPPTPTPPAEC